jgi:hypothetical protein
MINYPEHWRHESMEPPGTYIAEYSLANINVSVVCLLLPETGSWLIDWGA